MPDRLVLQKLLTAPIAEAIVEAGFDQVGGYVASAVTEDPVPSPRDALDDFMRGMRNRSKATDGFDPRPAHVCGLTAQQVTYTTRSPNGALNVMAPAVAVPHGPKMHLAALLVGGCEPHNPQFHSDAERFLREWKIVRPAAGRVQ